jgi:hypothetical protein
MNWMLLSKILFCIWLFGAIIEGVWIFSSINSNEAKEFYNSIPNPESHPLMALRSFLYIFGSWFTIIAWISEWLKSDEVIELKKQVEKDSGKMPTNLEFLEAFLLALLIGE